MTKLKALLLAAAAAGGLSSFAAAMPLTDLAIQNQGLVQDVRVICDDSGRRYNTRRHIYREEPGVGVYVGPRAHRYYDEPSYTTMNPAMGSTAADPGWD